MARTLESQRAMNSEQLAQRVKMGDHLEIAREVEHFALFTGRKEANAARYQLSTVGFDTNIVRKGWSKFELQARQVTSVEAAEVDAFVCQVFSIIESHHGSYDGWGGPLAGPPIGRAVDHPASPPIEAPDPSSPNPDDEDSRRNEES